ncbi:MAG: alpha/beta hydrolase [Saprospiraceae bacterium]|nr:alpha/beta hydrolase [Saprospiraceae bacterium]
MIEYLASAHADMGKERLPKNQKWQQHLAQMFFKTFGRLFPRSTAQFAHKIFGTPRWRARHKRPDALILSAKLVDFPFQNETIKCYEWGDDKATKLVLLAHGWESRGTALRMYVPNLIQKGYKVIAFDSLAHGDSTGKRNNLLKNAQTIVALNRHYGGFHGAVGHSFGCSSIVYAMQFLDKNMAINRLVFLAVPPRLRQIAENVFKILALPKSVQREFIAHIEKITGHSIELSDVATAEKEVKVGQLLLIHDEQDDVTPIDAAKRVEAAWDNALLLVTSGYGHFRIAKNPDVIKRIIRFIEE